MINPEQNMEAKIETSKTGFSAETRKSKDLFIGCLGGSVLMLIGIIAGDSTSDIGMFVALILIIGTATIFVYRGRKYIAMGIVSILLFPLIILCYLLATGSKI